MDLHEFQAKQRLAAYDIPLPRGQVADSAEAAVSVAQKIGGSVWAVKAQIHAGGRGKAGGIKIADSLGAVREAAATLLGARLVTAETDIAGKAVQQIYIEEQLTVAREVYLAVLVDRSRGQVAILASAEGGVEIENTVRQRPESIVKMHVDAAAGFDRARAEGLAAEMAFEGGQRRAAVELMERLYRAFLEHDASLIEINPLAVAENGELVALDVKMTLDDNALFRHADLELLRDVTEGDPSELEAQRHELNYVNLAGDIGCMVNGAGLALATLDMLSQAGGAAADFMDVRPVASREQVAAGFEMLQANGDIRAILVNVYGGGILRCDTIAEGIALAVRKGGLKVPLVVRAAGTNSEICRKVLEGQGIPVVFARDMAEAASRVVTLAKSEAA